MKTQLDSPLKTSLRKWRNFTTMSMRLESLYNKNNSDAIKNYKRTQAVIRILMKKWVKGEDIT
jgi:hypothetical protein